MRLQMPKKSKSWNLTDNTHIRQHKEKAKSINRTRVTTFKSGLSFYSDFIPVGTSRALPQAWDE